MSAIKYFLIDNLFYQWYVCGKPDDSKHFLK